MDFITDLWFLVPALGAVSALIGYFVKGSKLTKIRSAVSHISDLVKAYQTAMADGRLSEEEKDTLIDCIAEIVKDFT